MIQHEDGLETSLQYRECESEGRQLRDEIGRAHV